MMPPSPEEVWAMSDYELASILNSGFSSSERKRIHFFAPSFMYYKTSYYDSSPKDFPTISVTAGGCALKCKHCGGKVLDTMYPINTPEELLRLCKKLEDEGAQGCLISGGCLQDGSVPIGGFIDAMRTIKNESHLQILVHTGIIDSQTAKALKESGADAALTDVIGSDETIEEICRLNVRVGDYEDSLKALHDSNMNYVPHIIVGLHYGRLKGELHALRMVYKYRPSALVIIAFIPIRGTEMQNIEPSRPLEIAKVILAGRMIFPGTPLVLGCMRPRGMHRVETDILAIKAGVDAIAFPTEEAITFAKNHGYRTAFSSMCCSQVYMCTENLKVTKD